MKKQNLDKYKDFIKLVNEIADEINSILDNRDKERYFYGIVLLYSFVENLLKCLIGVETVWIKAKSRKSLNKRELEEMAKFIRSIKNLNFFSVEKIAFATNLIAPNLYKRIREFRKERNDFVHQFWIYAHRKNLLILRKKLEKYAGITSQLVGILNQRSKIISPEAFQSIYEQIFL